MPDLFTTEELQEQLRKLYEAKRNGLLSYRIKIGDYEREFRYRSAADLAAAISDIERKLGIYSAGPQNIVVRSHKGW